MSTVLPFLVVFIIALLLGILIGKLIFSARFHSEKISLEEKIIAANAQINQQKEQASTDKSNFEKQLQLKKLILKIYGSETKNKKTKLKSFKKNLQKNSKI